MAPEAKVLMTARGPIEVAETGEGPALLVLHGSMGGWQQALLFARVLDAPDFRVIAVSRPGYMHTPLSSGESAAAQADLYASLLDALGIARAGIIGLSAGSPSAIEFALRHPDRSWGLVLISACASKSVTPTPPVIFKVMAQLLRLSWVKKRVRAAWTKNLDKAASMFIVDPKVRAKTIADPDVGPLFAEFLLGTLDDMHLRTRGTENDIRIMNTTDHALEDLEVDTLVIHGTADTFLDYEQHAKAFEARIPRVQLLTVEGGDHATAFTHRPLVREVVNAYLREHIGRLAASQEPRLEAKPPWRDAEAPAWSRNASHS